MHGPWQIEIKLHYQNADEQQSVIGGSLAPGRSPTMEMINELAAEGLKRVREATNDPTWTLMNRNQFENMLICESVGGQVGRFATKEEWDDPAAEMITRQGV